MGHQILAVGEVLWDLLPSGKQLGGAPPTSPINAVRSVPTRGWSRGSATIDLGREVLERFRPLGLPDRDRPGRPRVPRRGRSTSRWPPTVSPDSRSASDVAWDRIEADEASLARAAGADAVCFGSLAQRSEPSRSAIRSLVAATRPGALRLFDVNLRPPFVDRDVIDDSLALANALKLNDQELPALAAMFGLPGRRAGGDGGSWPPLRALAGGPHARAGGGLLLADGVWSDHPGRPVDGVRHHRRRRRLHRGPGRRAARRPAPRRDQPPRQRGRGVRLLPARGHAGPARCPEVPPIPPPEARP